MAQLSLAYYFFKWAHALKFFFVIQNSLYYDQEWPLFYLSLPFLTCQIVLFYPFHHCTFHFILLHTFLIQLSLLLNYCKTTSDKICLVCLFLLYLNKLLFFAYCQAFCKRVVKRVLLTNWRMTQSCIVIAVQAWGICN